MAHQLISLFKLIVLVTSSPVQNTNLTHLISVLYCHQGAKKKKKKQCLPEGEIRLLEG